MDSVRVSPLIALISATPAAIPPAVSAFSDAFPDATIWNLLDDRLLQDASARGGVTSDLSDRMERLIQHAVTEGAEGILLTCSLYGAVAHSASGSLAIPIFAPDDAVFASVLADAPSDVLLVSAQEGPLTDSLTRFDHATASAGINTVSSGVVADGAAAAALAGDVDGLVEAIVQAVGSVSVKPSAVLLAQYSLAPAAERLGAILNVPVYSGPQSAATALRSALGSEENK
jgi:hypothetical protein